MPNLFFDRLPANLPTSETNRPTFFYLFYNILNMNIIYKLNQRISFKKVLVRVGECWPLLVCLFENRRFLLCPLQKKFFLILIFVIY